MHKLLAVPLLMLGAPGIPGGLCLLSIGFPGEPKWWEVALAIPLVLLGLPFYLPLWAGIMCWIKTP